MLWVSYMYKERDMYRVKEVYKYIYIRVEREKEREREVYIRKVNICSTTLNSNLLGREQKNKNWGVIKFRSSKLAS